MHAITIPEPGGPEALVWAEVPDPVPGEGEVLVEVVAERRQPRRPPAAAGLLQPAARRLPVPRPGVLRPDRRARPRRLRLGRRRRGVRAARGRRVRREGRRARPASCCPCPTGVDLVTAAALPEVTCTVWSNVFMVAHLRPGETLLVHGGSSGIGTMAIQLAKAVGATGRGHGGRPGEAGPLRRARRRHPDQLPRAGLRRGARARPPTGPGADVILDIMGAKYLDRNVQALAVNGRLAIIGLQGGVKGELNIGALLAKRAADHARPRCAPARSARRRRSSRPYASTSGR